MVLRTRGSGGTGLPRRGASLMALPTCRRRNQTTGRHRRLPRESRQRPRGCPAEQRDELAPPHSMTSSARASSVGGISRPMAFAVLRLIVSSNVVGCSIGKSAGLAPCKIRLAYQAPRLNKSDRDVPYDI